MSEWYNEPSNFMDCPKRADTFTGEPNEFWGTIVNMFMGHAIGAAYENAEKQDRRREFTRRFYKEYGEKANEIFVVHAGHYGDEPGDERTSTKRWAFDQLVSELVQHMEDAVEYGKRHKWSEPVAFP